MLRRSVQSEPLPTTTGLMASLPPRCGVAREADDEQEEGAEQQALVVGLGPFQRSTTAAPEKAREPVAAPARAEALACAERPPAKEPGPEEAPQALAVAAVREAVAAPAVTMVGRPLPAERVLEWPLAATRPGAIRIPSQRSRARG
jgi:hypothetical protein